MLLPDTDRKGVCWREVYLKRKKKSMLQKKIPCQLETVTSQNNFGYLYSGFNFVSSSIYFVFAHLSILFSLILHFICLTYDNGRQRQNKINLPSITLIIKTQL